MFSSADKENIFIGGAKLVYKYEVCAAFALGSLKMTSRVFSTIRLAVQQHKSARQAVAKTS